MELNKNTAFRAYETRFARRFGDRSVGTYVKFGTYLVTRLDRKSFGERLSSYMTVHQTVRRVLEDGTTISDALAFEFRERAAWIAMDAPNLLELFSGDVGDAQGRQNLRKPD
ncbi:MAG: hypothetical protein AAF550_12650 [Myxococcota bacterium]